MQNNDFEMEWKELKIRDFKSTEIDELMEITWNEYESNEWGKIY